MGTRDRGKHNPDHQSVPVKYEVVRAWRSENSRIWREYCIRRARLQQDRCEMSSDDNFTEYKNVKSTNAWLKFRESKLRLSESCNEWYLFHGTNPTAAENICHNDFKISLATHGTLYGRGTYFAESITKADEYAKPSPTGEYAVILCRVIGGYVRY